MVLEGLVKEVVDLVRKAGEEILRVYNSPFEVEEKEDKTPITLADRISHQILSEGLVKLEDVPLLSEEGKDIPYAQRKEWETFWLIDPLDGTKEFVKRLNSFTVNVALIHNSLPVLGVVYAPCYELMYWAIKGGGAYLNGKRLPLHKLPDPREEMIVVVSKSHLNGKTLEFLRELEGKTKRLKRISIGSSLKLCYVAEGKAHLYPRLSPTMEWDTGAGHCLLLEVGKNLYTYPEGKVLTYNKESLVNPPFVAR